MKWITIDKARPKFDVQYLVASSTGIELATLKGTNKTKDGLQHIFATTDPESTLANVTHLAVVDNPNKAEVVAE